MVTPGQSGAHGAVSPVDAAHGQGGSASRPLSPTLAVRSPALAGRQRKMSSRSVERRKFVSIKPTAQDDFAILDDEEGDESPDKDSPRPRRGSNLDAVLSSPYVRINRRPRPRSIDIGQPAIQIPLEDLVPRARRPSRVGNDRDSIDGGASSHPSTDGNLSDDAEQDVCFPVDETQFATGDGIDFDELDDFLTMQRRASFVSQHSDLKQLGTITEKSCSGEDSSHNSRSPGFQGLHGLSSPRPPSAVTPGAFAAERPTLGVPLATSASMPRPPGSGVRPRLYDPVQSNAPDRFSFFRSEQDETIHAGNLAGLVEPGQSFRELFRGHQAGCWWLDVMCPTDSEMRALTKSFGIHPLTAEDIRVQETREKVELFNTYYFVCFKSFHQETLDPVNVYVVVFKHGLVSFHFAPTTHPANVRRRIRQLRDYVSIGSDWISYAIIDDITDGFQPIITEIERESDAIEDAVLVSRAGESTEQEDTIRRIGGCRKKVMSVFRLLYGKADVIKMFAKRCNDRPTLIAPSAALGAGGNNVTGGRLPGVSELNETAPVNALPNRIRAAPAGEIGLYLGDIQDHLLTMTASLSQTEKILSRAHANYLAMLSTDSVSSNNRLNATLAKLTLVATMLVPLNLLSGLFGMNLKVPFSTVDNYAPFFTIVGVILAVVAVAIFLARRSRPLVI